MGKQYLEPLSRKDKTTSISVSLRGSLAESYRTLNEANTKVATDYLNQLLTGEIKGVIKLYDEGSVTIGFLGEMGMYPPDW